MLSSGRHSYSYYDPGALEMAISFPHVFRPTVRLDEAFVKVFDDLFKDHRLKMKLYKRLNESGKR